MKYEMIKIFANYGIEGREKETVYSTAAAAVCDEITVLIPSEMVCFDGETGNVGIVYGRFAYGLNECLVNISGRPAVRVHDTNGSEKFIILPVIG